MMWMTVLAATASASPWVKAPGEAYVKAGYGRFASRDFVQPDGAVLEDAQFRSQTVNLYGEVGVSRNVQVVFDLPYVDARNVVGRMPFVNRRPGDLQLGVEVGNLHETTPLSLQVLAKAPLYDNARFQGREDAASYPALGDGQVDLTALLAVGNGVKVGPLQGWLAAEAGYRLRTELFLGDSSAPDRRHVDGVPFSAQVGLSPQFRGKSAGWLFVSTNGVKNFVADESTREFLQVTAGGAMKLFSGIALEVGISELVWARNSATGGGLQLGISWTGSATKE
ncbi:MAG: hypothetical protein KTR31_11805 [Myxococcales bacterium]|nr:hypothetical protein [Myxococcales bacterium]